MSLFHNQFITQACERLILGALTFSLSLSCAAYELKAGERLTFVLSESRPGGEEVMQTYFSKAFPLAQAAGMRELTTFKVEKTLAGDGKPEGSGLYLWPSKAAADKTRNDPDYLQHYRPLRTQAWRQLQSVDMEITRTINLELDKTKTYTAALVWLKDKAAYNTYYEGTEALRDKLGVKTLLKLPAVRYDKLTEGEIIPPDLLVLLEWKSPDGLEAYTKAKEFQAQYPNFQQGVNKMEWFQLGFWPEQVARQDTGRASQH